MNETGAGKSPMGARIKTELREFAVIAVYLFICFGAVAYLKATILRAEGIPFAPFALAAAKALIFAKFILVGRAIRLGERSNPLPLIWPTLHKSVAYFVLLFVLNLVEEIVVGLIHHRSVADSLAGIGGGRLDQIVASSFLVWLILIPYFAFRALGEVVGERNLVRVFLYPRRRAMQDA